GSSCAVELLEPIDDFLDRLDARALARDAIVERGLARERADRPRERDLVPAREGETRDAVLDGLGHPSEVRRDDGDPVPVRLVDRDRHVLVPDRGYDEEVESR